MLYSCSLQEASWMVLGLTSLPVGFPRRMVVMVELEWTTAFRVCLAADSDLTSSL